MGKKQEQKPQRVGNAFFASFGIAIASKIDRFVSLWVDDEKIDIFPNDASVRNFRTQTGKKAEQYPSKTGKSLIQLYNGINNSINPTMSNISGIINKYNNLAYVFFNNAFLGDNVQNYPSYAFEVQRTHILGWKHNNQLLDEITTYDGTKQANPSVVLYHILNVLSEIDESLLDKDSFFNAAITLKNEKFGLALIINTENQLKKIIEEIIRHIDATFFFNIQTGKYTLKLYRDDYNINNLISINEDNVYDIKYKKGSYQDLSTHLVLNYISQVNYKKTTIYAENASIKELIKQNKTTEINFLCVQDNNLASKILSREFKKYCTPISKISFKVPNSFKLSVFDVFKFSSKKLGINNMILRIIEVSADEYEKNYYEITATEDIYNANDYEVITYQDSNIEKIDYSITSNAKVISNVIVLNRDITNNDSYPILLINDAIDNQNNYANIDFINYNDKVFSQTTERYTTLNQQIDFGKYNYFLDEVILNRQNWMENIELTEQEWQANSRMIVVNNEIMAYKKLIIIDANTIKITNVIRNINNTLMQTHEVNDIVFFIENFDVFELTNYDSTAEYAQLKIKVGNLYNQTSEYNIYVDNFEEFNNPYPVSNFEYDNITRIAKWDITQVNKNYTSNYSTLEVLEKNVTSLSETQLEPSQIFQLDITYSDDTKELINTTNKTYTFSKAIKVDNCYIYNIINNKYSNYVKF